MKKVFLPQLSPFLWVQYDDNPWLWQISIINTQKKPRPPTLAGKGMYQECTRTYQDFIIDFIREEVERLEDEKPGLLDSKFNTFPKKHGGFLML